MIRLLSLFLNQTFSLGFGCSLLAVSCSGDALQQARAQQAALQQEVDGLTQQAASTQAKITTLERQYPQFGASKALLTKELETLVAATAFLEASVSVVTDNVKETNLQAERYRAKYLAP